MALTENGLLTGVGPAIRDGAVGWPDIEPPDAECLLCRRGSHHPGGNRVGDQDTLGSDRHCPADRTRRRLGGDAMDCLAAWLPAAARPALVSSLAGNAGLYAGGVLLVVARLRRLCAAYLYRGRVYRGVRRVPVGGDRVRLVDLAGPGPRRRDLWLREVGDAA